MFKILLFSSLAVVLIGIVVLVAYKVTSIQMDPYATDKPEKKAEERKYVPILDSVLLGTKETPDFKLVIIDRGEQHNVKCIIYLGYSKEYAEKGPQFFDELKSRTPMLREIVYRVMGTKSFEELQYKNLDRIEEELVSKMNETLEHGSIVDIQFNEYIVQ
ncbi:flagellar basal body-associated FliL family protein [bacterium]|nr:flagellar basal body-associated FliL family protein [bacterium]